MAFEFDNTVLSKVAVESLARPWMKTIAFVSEQPGGRIGFTRWMSSCADNPFSAELSMLEVVNDNGSSVRSTPAELHVSDVGVVPSIARPSPNMPELFLPQQRMVLSLWRTQAPCS